MKNILITQRRVFIIKAAWSMTAPTFIGELEEVVKEGLTNEAFKNGIEYIKELEGLKFVRVSKTDIEKQLSNSPEQIELFKQLSKKY